MKINNKKQVVARKIAPFLIETMIPISENSLEKTPEAVKMFDDLQISTLMSSEATQNLGAARARIVANAFTRKARGKQTVEEKKPMADELSKILAALPVGKVGARAARILQETLTTLQR